MISLAIWCHYVVVNFLKTTTCTLPMGSCNFVIFEKFTRAYLHQIALEIMLFTDTNEIN